MAQFEVKGLHELAKDLKKIPSASKRDRILRNILLEGVKPLVAPTRKRVDDKTKRYAINAQGKQTRAYKKLTQGRKTIGRVTGVAAGKYNKGFVSYNMRNTVKPFKSKKQGFSFAMVGFLSQRKKGAWYAYLQNSGGGKYNFRPKEVFILSDSEINAANLKAEKRVADRFDKIVQKAIGYK